MAYFPESIMPSRLKDESQDVKGNQYIITAADVNKHDEEIRAIERVLGVRRPNFPGMCFSGWGNCSATSGFSGGSSGFSGFSAAGGCYPGPSECSSTVMDVFTALSRIFQQLAQVRDDYAYVTSGIVACANALPIPGMPGKIVFPTNWPMTTLDDTILDATTDAEQPLADLPYVTLSDVSSMPEIGYVSLINDMSDIISAVTLAQVNWSVNQVFPTSLLFKEDALYSADDRLEVNHTLPNDLAALADRRDGVGTNVEMLFYAGLDLNNKRILNVKRKQLGTTSTRHVRSDLVFKGRLGLQIAPVMARVSNKGLNQLDCYLRSDGTIRVRARNGNVPNLTDNTSHSYAQYQAVLLRTLDEIPPFTPGEEGCI